MSVWVANGGAQALLAWTDAVGSQSSRETGDPLGLRTWANQIASDLAPGLTNVTSRVQAYGLICAGIEVGRQDEVLPLGAVEAWLRFERLWVLSQTAFAQNATSSAIGSWPGRNRAVHLLQGGDGDDIDLTVPLLGHQLASGIWGGYRRSAGIFGLTRSNFEAMGTSPAHVERTPTYGNRLSTRWRALNQHSGWTSIQVAKVLARGSVTRSELKRIFRPDGVPTGLRATAHKALTDVLTEALDSDAQFTVGSRLRGLRAVWEQVGSESETGEKERLTVAHLRRHKDLLDPSQVELIPQAASVLWLFKHVEKPYRAYLCGDKVAPGASIWDHKAWSVAEVYAPDVRMLHEHARRGHSGSWAGVHEWAQALAERRGSQATTPGRAPTGYDKSPAPAMSLRAAEALFASGFLGPRVQSRKTLRNARLRAERSANA